MNVFGWQCINRKTGTELGREPEYWEETCAIDLNGDVLVKETVSNGRNYSCALAVIPCAEIVHSGTPNAYIQKIDKSPPPNLYPRRKYAAKAKKKLIEKTLSDL